MSSENTSNKMKEINIQLRNTSNKMKVNNIFRNTKRQNDESKNPLRNKSNKMKNLGQYLVPAHKYKQQYKGKYLASTSLHSCL